MTMTKLNPNNIAPEWPAVPWVIRCHNAVLLLSTHRFITPKEAEAAYERIQKWEATHKSASDPGATL